MGVAGQAAVNIHISQNLADILPLYIAVVIGISVIIMIVVFRSLLVPIVATGGFILSLFATYGALTALFQRVWFADLFGVPSTGPVLSFLPLLLVGILFGLAMDYQLFLASGRREAYVHGAPVRLAVVRGFRAGRSVVVAAGLIMVAVFGGFIFSESTLIAPSDSDSLSECSWMHSSCGYHSCRRSCTSAGGRHGGWRAGSIGSFRTSMSKAPLSNVAIRPRRRPGRSCRGRDDHSPG